MSKNNLRWITLVRGPIWRIHSLTLIISWNTFIIHQTHYEESDWSRAFNQFTIACELDMINAISAADIAFIMSSSTSAWLLIPLESSPQKQNGWTLRFCLWGWVMWKMYNKTWYLRIVSCLACVYRVMDARGKFGEHERSVRVARGAAESNSSFLSALQTSRASITWYTHS